MARTFHVYPKAVLDSSTWTFIVKVYEHSTRTNTRLTHGVPAGVTAAIPLRLLKIGFDLIVADTDTPQDVDDALFIDDIKPGAQVETVWGNWQDRAETILAGLAPGYTFSDYWAAWTQQDTATVRSDARRALITQRGWSIPHVYWLEGDGTSHDASDL